MTAARDRDLAKGRDVVVVGIDGSDPSRAALGFGLEEAKLRGLALRVVCAWHYPLAGFIAGFEPPGPRLDPGELDRDAEAQLDSSLEALGRDLAAVEVERRVREGSAPAVLLEEARDAARLVVGSRGRGGFSGLLLGSVSQQCVSHAACPVAVVHGPREAAHRSGGE